MFNYNKNKFLQFPFNKDFPFSAVFFGTNNGLKKTLFIKGFHTSIFLKAETKTLNTTGPQDPKVETSVKSIFMLTLSLFHIVRPLNHNHNVPVQVGGPRKIKGPNWFKYLILFLILLIGLYFLIPYFQRPNILFLSRSISVLGVKLVLVLITSIAILYNLISIFILIKYSFMEDNTINIPQFLPNFISNYLIELKRISKYDSINRFIQMYITTTIFLFILLLIFLFVTNILH